MPQDEEVSSLAGELRAALGLVKAEALKLARAAVDEGIATLEEFKAMKPANRDKIIAAADLREASLDKLNSVIPSLLDIAPFLFLLWSIFSKTNSFAGADRETRGPNHTSTGEFSSPPTTPPKLQTRKTFSKTVLGHLF